MIKRINLIEQTAFSLTYLRLAQIGAVLLAITALFIGYQTFNIKRLEKKLDNTKTELKTLEGKRDKLMKTPVKKKVSVGEYQELFDRLDKIPNWSKIISDVIQRLPNTVWLTSFKSLGGISSGSSDSSGKSNPKSNRNQDKKDTSSKKTVSTYKLEINGLSSSMKNITEYSSELSQSPYLNNIKVDSQKQSFGFSFTIIGVIDSNAK